MKGCHLLVVIASLTQCAVLCPFFVGEGTRQTSLAHRGPRLILVETFGTLETGCLASGILVGAGFAWLAAGLTRQVLVVAQITGTTLDCVTLVSKVAWGHPAAWVNSVHIMCCPCHTDTGHLHNCQLTVCTACVVHATQTQTTPTSVS